MDLGGDGAGTMDLAKFAGPVGISVVILSSSSAGNLANGTEPEQAPPPGRLVRHTHDGLDKRRPGWSPDAKSLTFSRHEPDGAHLWQYVMTLEPSAPPRRLTARPEAEFDAAFAPDGTRLLLVTVRFIALQGDLDISTVGADGSGLKILVTEGQGKVVHQEWPAWSADGKRFAFTSTHEGNQEVYTASADGTDVVRLTQHAGHDAHPCWAPDGRTIAFATDRWGGLELAAVQGDGTGVTRLTESPGLDDYPAYSPDGTRLAFVSNRDGQYEVYLADAGMVQNGGGQGNTFGSELTTTSAV
jgi:TolB protein